jgi:hypothetical protein
MFIANVPNFSLDDDTDVACTVSLLIKLPNSTRMLFRDLTSGVASNTKIVFCDEVFNVHKAILALRSDVFKAMFNINNNTVENRSGFIKINNIDPVVMKTLIHGNNGRSVCSGQVQRQGACPSMRNRRYDQYHT